MPNNWAVLLDIFVLLSVALLLGMVFERLRQDAVGGYLVAGILLGPGVSGWIRDVEDYRILAELGVALLLFTIGLEFSWRRLRELGSVALFGGTIQILLTAAIAALASITLGFSPAEAIVVGAALSLSSTAVVLRVLTDRAMLDSLHGRNSLGILLLQDLAVVPLVVLISALGEGLGGPAAFGGFALSLAGATVLVAAMFLLTKYAFPRVLHMASAYRNRDLPMVLAFAVCLGAVVACHALGLSPILGAFVAGMLLSESPFSQQIRADIIPLRAGFLTLFFASFGMMAHVPANQNLLMIAPLALAIMCGKAMIVGFVIRLFRQPHGIAVTTGLTLAQIGEFSFVLLELGYLQGLVAPATFQVLLCACVVTLVLTPNVIVGAPRLGEIITRVLSPPAKVPSVEAHPGQETEHSPGPVIIVGFGPAGQRVAEMLREAAIRFAVVDLNPRSVAAQRPNLPIKFGDATRPEILNHLGLRHSRAVVVTVPDPQTSELIVRQAKRMAPHVPVIARSRYHAHAPGLLRAGVDRLVDEEDLMGRRLGAEVVDLPQSVGLA